MIKSVLNDKIMVMENRFLVGRDEGAGVRGGGGDVAAKSSVRGPSTGD